MSTLSMYPYISLQRSHTKSTFHKDTVKTHANKSSLFLTLKGHSRPGCRNLGTNNLPKMMRQHETDDGQMMFVEHHMID